MKIIHTADWHLGKLVQGVHMTDDQREVLQQLVETVREERPDAVIIAGDLYDRAVPPTEAVELLDELLQEIVIGLETPVLAISGNHDSPDRLSFGTKMMQARGLYLAGQLDRELSPVVLCDPFGEVHVYLVPYADPAIVRHLFGVDNIRTHDDAMRHLTSEISAKLDPEARHVFVGHAFVTPGAAPQANTSDAERPLSVGGADQVHAEFFDRFHYTALGHLHQAHHVGDERIRYAGSPLKYSISEETHRKCFLIVELDGAGNVQVEQRLFKPRRDMRSIAAPIEEIEQHEGSDDYVFVTLLNDDPVLFPMEKVRSVYPNALHVQRKVTLRTAEDGSPEQDMDGMRRESDPVKLFASFYKEVKGVPLSEEKSALFEQAFTEVLGEEGGAE